MTEDLTLDERRLAELMSELSEDATALAGRSSNQFLENLKRLSEIRHILSSNKKVVQKFPAI